MNWFERHLNWTLIIIFLLTLLFVYFASFAEDSSIMFYTFVAHCVIITGTCDWVLERKGRSRWDLTYLILIYPLGIITVMLRSNKRDEISRKVQLSDTPSTILATNETLIVTAGDKKIEPGIGKTWKPITAGILNIVTSVLVYVFAAWVFLILLMDPSHEALVIGIVSVAVATLTLISGVLALKRKGWRLALVGSITMCAYVVYFLVQTSKSPFELPAIFAWLGMPAFILIAFSKDEFRQQKELGILEQQKGKREFNAKEFLGAVLVLFGCILVPVSLAWFGLGAFGAEEVYIGIILFISAMLVLGISLYIRRKFRLKMPLVWWI
ncbi:hypothetical protein ACFLT8_03710 [Chloroflexota bacterium]